MDNVRQKNWFSITAYVVSSLIFLGLLLFIAETYFPSPSSNFMPRQPDRITRWLFNTSPRSNLQKTAAYDTAQQEKLFFRLNKKIPAGKVELIYRGLANASEFKIDLIVPDLDPQVSYPYRFNISKAKESFRLGNRNYQLVFAKKAAIQLKQIQ